jgi:pyruvate dehydrogenase E1 component alpha subunit
MAVAARQNKANKKTVSEQPEFSKDEELHAYREMLLIRRFEEKSGQMYGMGLIGGFCHLYIGQEAVVVGMQMASQDGDQVITGYRDDGRVCLTYFGDGAANQGQVYESFNMAELWKLPVVYVIENNRYAMGTSVNRASAQTDFSKRGVSFGIPGEQVDGMDVRAVRDAGLRAMDFARSGQGPYILEMQTYRYRGHSMSDPAKYRTKDEVSRMRDERDPIESARRRLLDEWKIPEDQLKAIDAKVREIVNEAAEFATHDPEPDTSELWTDILLETR